MNCPDGSHDDPRAPYNEPPPRRCPTCGGSGNAQDEEDGSTIPCPRCEGAGVI